ncbi:putative DNA-directed RNA polymerases I, II, and III subunit RPABC4 [Hypsibius exemplaris]|uniref:DNA-directed RNA polymerases I, II, and III subunit RPABC4 n=1 Tax=Hypsibius exemplaris TaxID=2072580 RepID=A0A1W0X4C1_HYPEX|nr:putative DNA-directed RNA polymerases I, II, and III subunit RPABC4 [Hypsibius exemplaris]
MTSHYRWYCEIIKAGGSTGNTEVWKIFKSAAARLAVVAYRNLPLPTVISSTHIYLNSEAYLPGKSVTTGLFSSRNIPENRLRKFLRRENCFSFLSALIFPDYAASSNSGEKMADSEAASSSGAGASSRGSRLSGREMGHSETIPEEEKKAVVYICGDCHRENGIRGREPIRCQECGYRIMYKKRTKRLIVFDAR